MSARLRATQIELVLAALRAGPITSLQMIKLHGITRLATHIHVLRQDGYQIVSKLMQVATRHKQSATVAEYTLVRRRRAANRVAARLAKPTARRARAAKPRTRTNRSA